MCNHDEDKNTTYLSSIDLNEYEVYMCECGGLLDIQDEANYTGDDWKIMTPGEFDRMIAEIKMAERVKIVDVIRNIDRKDLK